MNAVARCTHGNLCSDVKALDVAGERWTPLVVRELLPGARRFTDLSSVLAGLGTSRLAARLNQLEARQG